VLKILFGVLITTIFLNAQNVDSSSFVKERKEVMDLKKELNQFYNKKEAEYKKRQLELKTLLAQIEREKRDIEDLYKRNKDILSDIEGAVATKTSKIFNSMKPKNAADIFNKMIEDGKIEDVFDILLKLKEKKVTLLMKFMTVENSASITQMLENYNVDQ